VRTFLAKNAITTYRRSDDKWSDGVSAPSNRKMDQSVDVGVRDDQATVLSVRATRQPQLHLCITHHTLGVSNRLQRQCSVNSAKKQESAIVFSSVKIVSVTLNSVTNVPRISQAASVIVDVQPPSYWCKRCSHRHYLRNPMQTGAVFVTVALMPVSWCIPLERISAKRSQPL
jgi:hypothetical protein